MTAGKSFIKGYTNETDGIFTNPPVIIFDDFTTSTKYVDFPFKVKSSAMKILKLKSENAKLKFIFYAMQGVKFDTTEHRRYWISLFSQEKIPLPPLDIQKEIVEELEQYQKVIDGAQQVVDNYKPHFEIDESWDKVDLSEIVINVRDSVIPNQMSESTVKYIGLDNIKKGKGVLTGATDCDPRSIKSSKRVFKTGDILYGKLRPNLNKVYVAEFDGICSTDILAFRLQDYHKSLVYHSILISDNFNKKVLKGITGSQLPRTSFNHMKSIKVPIIPSDFQKQIVERLDSEKKIIEGNKKLIEIYSKKIENRINKIWGE